jgi:Ca2+-binding RTX toxin-like protein
LIRGDDGSNYLFGLAGNDRLFGGDNDDVIVGGLKGSDFLDGGSGGDILIGGDVGLFHGEDEHESDTFYFTRPFSGVDFVADYEPGVDKLLFRGFNFGFGEVVNEFTILAGPQLVGGSDPVPVNDSPTFLYDNDPSVWHLSFDIDGKGPETQSLVAILRDIYHLDQIYVGI